MKAKLALEDGEIYTGTSFGSEGERAGEVVFNTAMSGYQEILTDPSYKGQIVVMTYPLIGNYGINLEDYESRQSWVEGFAVREYSKRVSNYRATETLQEFLKRHGIIAIEGIDTRALTRRLRVHGSMNGIISTVDMEEESLIKKARCAPKIKGLDLVKFVTSKDCCHWTDFLRVPSRGLDRYPTPSYRVALIDCGVKFNIIRSLVKCGCDVIVFSAFSKAAQIMESKPHGICISNGPGDPEAVGYLLECVQELIESKLPVFGICLGHQILGLALGAKVFKLKFGHHGANHPVKNMATGKVEITSQNHGFAISQESIKGLDLEVTHVNLNDNTIEGIRHRRLPIFSVQYHPEASPGPHDSSYLFDEFCNLMRSRL
jgi:carbamoyl-phosphate synthase small subunit